MSCILAMAQPSFGFVCADTRLTVRPSNGPMLINDEGTFEMSLPDGTTLQIGPESRKIRQFYGGWMASPDISFAMEAWGLRLNRSQLNDLDTIEQALREQYAEAQERLYAHFGNPSDEPKKSAIFVVYDTGTRFDLANLRFHDASLDLRKSDFYFHFPREMNPNDISALYEHVAQNLVVPRDKSGLYNMVRFIAEVFQNVHRNSKTVSDRVDLGIIVRTGPEQVVNFYLHGASSELLSADDLELSRLFRSV